MLSRLISEGKDLGKHFEKNMENSCDRNPRKNLLLRRQGRAGDADKLAQKSRENHRSDVHKKLDLPLTARQPPYKAASSTTPGAQAMAASSAKKASSTKSGAQALAASSARKASSTKSGAQAMAESSARKTAKKKAGDDRLVQAVKRKAHPSSPDAILSSKQRKLDRAPRSVREFRLAPPGAPKVDSSRISTLDAFTAQAKKKRQRVFSLPEGGSVASATPRANWQFGRASSFGAAASAIRARQIEQPISSAALPPCPPPAEAVPLPAVHRLVLRLLPTAAAEPEDAFLGRQPLDHQQATNCAYLYSEMMAAHSGDDIRCFRWPYRQRWPDQIIHAMQDAICSVPMAKDNKLKVKVEVEQYHFLNHDSAATREGVASEESWKKASSQERDACCATVKDGILRFFNCIAGCVTSSVGLLPSSLCGGARAVGVSDPALADITLTAALKQVPDIDPTRFNEMQKLHFAEAMNRSTAHWREAEAKLDQMAPRDGGCRAVVLADTSVMARNQASWAKSQSLLATDKNGSPFEVPLLRRSEHVLVLPLMGEVGSLKDPNEIGRVLSGMLESTWDPWKKALAEMPPGTAKRVQVSIGKASKAIVLPDLPRNGCADEHLRYLKRYYSHPDHFRSSGRVDHEAAWDAVKTFFDEADELQRYQLLWFAVVVPEAKADVEEWLLREMKTRVKMDGFEPLMWAVARFWAVENRTKVFRGDGMRKQRDPIDLSLLLQSMEVLPEFHGNQFHAEKLWVGHEVRHREVQKRHGVRRVRASVWQAYSTADPLAGLAGLSLEMQQQAMQRFDSMLEKASSEGRLSLAAETRPLLLVAGTLARRLYVLSQFVSKFTVMIVSGKDAPQGGTSKKIASLCVTRRVIYKFPEEREKSLEHKGLQANVFDAEVNAGVNHLLSSVGCAVAGALNEARLMKVSNEARLLTASIIASDNIASKTVFTDVEKWWANACKKTVDEHLNSWICSDTSEKERRRVLTAVAGLVHELDVAEARHRMRLPFVLRAKLHNLWKAQMRYALENAASASVLGLGDPVPMFLETLLEQLCRASEEPILCFLSSQPEWKAIRTSDGDRLEYSQTFKRFVREILMPLCSGPAGALRLLRWLDGAKAGVEAAGQCLEPFLRLGESSRPTAEEKTNGLQQDTDFLDDVAPQRGLWELEWERRRFRARDALVSMRRQAVMAQKLTSAGAPPWLLTCALSQLPIEAGDRFPGGKRSFSKAAAPSQRKLLSLLLYRENDPSTEALKASLLCSECPRVLPKLSSKTYLDAAYLSTLSLDCPDEAPVACAFNASSFIQAWKQQLDLSTAIRRARNFMEKYTEAKMKEMDAEAMTKLSVVERLRSDYVNKHPKLRHRGTQWFLLHAIWLSCRNRQKTIKVPFDINMDLAAALDYAQEYCEKCFYREPDEGELKAALSLVQEKLMQTFKRPRGSSLCASHKKQRREQGDAFCENQREIYYDRARARGVLEGFHRLKGESQDVWCWIAEGEVVRPSLKVCRALAADLCSEAWYCSSVAAASEGRNQQQHEISHADTELVRQLLCAHAERTPSQAQQPTRCLKGWRPDPANLGCPQASSIEQLSPSPRAQQALGAHEINQVILRRLTAHFEDTARMACLLREPILVDNIERESHLAIASCARLKRALEPLTHSIEIWPLFLNELGPPALRDCAQGHYPSADAREIAFFHKLLQAGCPVPAAARVAMHRWLQLQRLPGLNEDYTAPITPSMLLALAEALEEGRLPDPLPPSPVWDESEITGRQRCSEELPQPASAAERLRDFEEQGEEKWYRANKDHFGRSRREREWQTWGQRKKKSNDRIPCRPWRVFLRRLWVLSRGLPMTFWDEAGILPDIFKRSNVRLPVVIVARTSGRKMLPGSLAFGPYTPKETARYIGDSGSCIQFGIEQQHLQRAFMARGLNFIAVNLDRLAVLKQFLARASVNYLLGRWKHFPLFQGKGKSSFPWLGARWREGIVYLQQLVRQTLREELLRVEPQLEPLRKAWRAVRTADEPKQLLWRVLAEDQNMSRLRQSTGNRNLCVPDVALRIEALQEKALSLAPAHDVEAAALETDSDKSDAEKGTPARPRKLKILDRTLAERAVKSKGSTHVLLIFPATKHILEKCSAPLSKSGRLMPKSLTKWLEDTDTVRALETNKWPGLGPGDLRPEEPAQNHVHHPLKLGGHIVVIPDWATYVRGLSERAGRGPRDAHAPWECRALPDPPPNDHDAAKLWKMLRVEQERANGPLRHRRLVQIYSRCFPRQRVRGRGGDREEEAPPQEGRPPVASREETGKVLRATMVDKEKVRDFLESYPLLFAVTTCTDLGQRQGFRGATQCVKIAELNRLKLRLRAGNLDGARYLHGVPRPHGVPGNTAQEIVEEEHDMLARECAALEPELESERAEAAARTLEDLLLPRWPESATPLPGLRGSRAPQPPSLGEADEPDEAKAVVVLVAGRAKSFEKSTVPGLPVFARKHLCVALYPPVESLTVPCYQVQVGSLRLLERQLVRHYRDRRILLVAVDTEAKRFFKGLHNLIRANMQGVDAVFLPEEQLPADLVREPWEELSSDLHAGTDAVGWCHVEQLLDEKATCALCARPDQEALRQDWLSLRADLIAAASRKEARTDGAGTRQAE